jgi:nucleoside-specific outer membrane channel protein Tsx
MMTGMMNKMMLGVALAAAVTALFSVNAMANESLKKEAGG